MSASPNVTQAIADAALDLGFCRVGFTDVSPLNRGADALARWLDHGFHGEMAFMAAHGDRRDPRYVFADAKSCLVVALAYGPRGRLEPHETLVGSIAQYAQGDDYHHVMRTKLEQLGQRCAQILERPVALRPCVDSAPLLERELAARSGIAFLAKSTMAIVPGVGSYVLLGELFFDVTLPLLSQPTRPRCGTCTACIDACPTKAFVGPYTLDARRCIAYLTIEFRGSIPRPLRPLMGNHVFGCDICQQVCPFNASKKPRPIDASMRAHARLQEISLVGMLQMTSSDYRRLTAGTALRRASRAQLARNAAVALGNSNQDEAVEPLINAALQHGVALVRGHAAWALGQLQRREAKPVLDRIAQSDEDATVRDEALEAYRRFVQTP